ncbi:hypothetical protein FNB79_15300 [Formosa sediminum]|uniref:Schlafen AlbA-2 domain-containing protein n=1 Tax=Formosa sediminum TaxID=2594004 RepID=A0A516GUT0_9FLAO|nr:ATP-binding protein [Formosa sediminum]QDO95279.1 hypothetical protein FNB79_15300 [Formosa sediminum]
MSKSNKHVTTSLRVEPKQHRWYLVVKQNEHFTIVQDCITKKEYPSKKIYIPEGGTVILWIKYMQDNGNPFFDYSVVNDYKEGNSYVFDVVKQKEKGYEIENNENIILFIPGFFANQIDNNRITLKFKDYDLIKNQVLWEAETQNNPKQVLFDLTQFKYNEHYNFIIIDYFEYDDGNAIFIVEKDGVTAKVRTYAFQDKDWIGNTIRCKVTGKEHNNLYLYQDRTQLLKNLYSIDEVYSFEIEELEKDGFTNYYILRDKYDFTHRFYLNNITDSADYNVIGTTVQYYLKGIHENGYLMLNALNNPQNKFYDANTVFSEIGHADKVQNYFFNLEEEIIEFGNSNKAFSNLFDLYQTRENTWVFSYLNFVSIVYIKVLVNKKEFETARIFLNIIKDLELWILEGSDYLSNFSDKTRDRIVDMAEKELEGITSKLEAIEIIIDEKQYAYIDDILEKITRSQYLRIKSITIFKNLLLYSDEVLNQSTSKVIDIITFLVKQGKLEEHEYKRFNGLLAYKIKSEKHQLNVKLSSRNYVLQEENKNDIKLIIRLIILQVVLDIEIDNKKHWILNSATLFRFYSYLEEDVNLKKRLLFHATQCITSSKGLPLTVSELIHDFNIYNYVTQDNFSLISPIKHPKIRKKIYKNNGAIFESEAGFHLVNPRHIKSDLNPKNYQSLGCYLNGTLMISSSVKLNKPLSGLDNMDEFEEAWNEFYYFDDKEVVNSNGHNIKVGDIVTVRAKNYLPGNDKLLFLQILGQGERGEGVLYIDQFSKVNLDGFSGIIFPGDEFDVMIQKVEERGFHFSLLSQVSELMLLNINKITHTKAVIIHIKGKDVFLLTKEGFGSYAYNYTHENIDVGQVFNVEIESYSKEFQTLQVTISEKIDEAWEVKSILRQLFKTNFLKDKIETEIVNDFAGNKGLIEELITCIESLITYEKDQIIRLEIYHLLGLFTSITKSSRSYYYSALIDQINLIHQFKNLQNGQQLKDIPIIGEETINSFQLLKQIESSYQLLATYNDVTAIDKLVDIDNKNELDSNLNQIRELILANNLLLKNGITNTAILEYAKNVIYEKLTNEEFDHVLEISENTNLNSEVEELGLEELSLGKENTTIEFKTSVFYHPAKNAVDRKEQGLVIMKTVSGFLNAAGGNLYIGVNDNGFPIGLEEEYKVVKGDSDEYQRYIRKLIVEYFNKDINGLIEFKFLKLNDKEYLEMNIPEYDTPVPLLDEFYQRQGNETRILRGTDLFKFFERKNNQKNKPNTIEEKQLKMNNEFDLSNVPLGQQSIKFEFFTDQKKEVKQIKKGSVKSIHKPIAFLYFLKGNNFMISKSKFSNNNIQHIIAIGSNDRKKYLLQGYDNGCVNKIKVRTILDKKFEYIYSNSSNLEANVKLLHLVDDTDLILINTLKDNDEYLKLYEVSNISVHDHFHLKGNNLIQDSFDGLKSFQIIQQNYKSILKRLIYKSRQNLGKNMSNKTFSKEIKVLKNITKL